MAFDLGADLLVAKLLRVFPHPFVKPLWACSAVNEGGALISDALNEPVGNMHHRRNLGHVIEPELFVHGKIDNSRPCGASMCLACFGFGATLLHLLTITQSCIPARKFLRYKCLLIPHLCKALNSI